MSESDADSPKLVQTNPAFTEVLQAIFTESAARQQEGLQAMMTSFANTMDNHSQNVNAHIMNLSNHFEQFTQKLSKGDVQSNRKLPREGSEVSGNSTASSGSHSTVNTVEITNSQEEAQHPSL